MFQNSMDVPILEESRKKPKTIDLLDQFGINPEDKESILHGLYNPTPGTDSPLHISISKNYPLLTEWLLTNGANVNAINETKQTPLHYAIMKNNIALVNALLDRGADVNAAIKTGETPIHYAAMETGEMVTLLLDRGADINAKSSYGVPLHYAVGIQAKEAFGILIRRGANFYEPNSSGETPLQYALSLNANDILTTFLEIAPIDTPIDSKGNTLLHSAVNIMNLDVVAELLRRGANYIAVNSDNKTPLHLVVEKYSVPDIPPTLLNIFLSFMKKDINRPIDSKGNILLHYAVFIKCDIKIIDLLLQNGSNVDAINSEGNTPIAYYKSYLTLDKLLQYRNINAPINNKGTTLLQDACDKRSSKTLLFLKERGADGTGIVCNDIILHELAIKPFMIHEPGVYTFGGHGCDTGIELTVPKGCLYITLAVCGDNITMKYGFQERMLKCGAILYNPKQYQKEIEAILGCGIYIHDEDTPYTDMQYAVPALHDAKQNNYISATSGLCRVNDINPTVVNIHTGDTYKYDSYKITMTSRGDPANPDIFNKIYSNSLLPSIPVEYRGATAEDTYTNFPTGRIQQSSLFKIYPGIYYNLVCRSPCKNNVPPLPRLQRTRSINRRNTIDVKTIKSWFDADEATAVAELDKVIADPSVYFVQDYPGEFDEVVGKYVTRLTGRENKERVRIIVRGGRRKKRTKRKRV
jgi:ankyrin repeat protein